MSQIIGRISQIIGPVIDVYFDTKGEDPEKILPRIHDALRVKRPNTGDLVIEVQQHIGEDTVRCVAMDNTEGFHRSLVLLSMFILIQKVKILKRFYLEFMMHLE